MISTDSLRKIKALQKANNKYTIIECGNGAAVANTLMMVPGSSALVDRAIQPYSKESQTETFGPFKRSVSLEAIRQILLKYPGNTIVTSFQLQGRDTKVLTHGYIGCSGPLGTAIYHISYYANNRLTDEFEEEEFDDISARSHQFEFIAEVAVNIMYRHVIDASHTISNFYVDGIWGMETYNLPETLHTLSKSDERDTMVVFDGGEWKRMEDLMRQAKGLILMRGSFNPIHEGHIAMLEAAKAQYPDYTVACLISLHNRDKADVNVWEAMDRAYKILEKGYQVIFSSLPYFRDSSSTIRKRWNTPIVYPVGTDTINRWMVDTVQSEVDLMDGLKSIRLRHGHIEEFDLETEALSFDEKVDKVMEYPGYLHFGEESWDNVKFLIFERQGVELHQYSKYFTKIIEFEKTYKDTGVSSTKIRTGQWSTSDSN